METVISSMRCDAMRCDWQTVSLPVRAALEWLTTWLNKPDAGITKRSSSCASGLARQK